MFGGSCDDVEVLDASAKDYQVDSLAFSKMPEKGHVDGVVARKVRLYPNLHRIPVQHHVNILLHCFAFLLKGVGLLASDDFAPASEETAGYILRRQFAEVPFRQAGVPPSPPSSSHKHIHHLIHTWSLI